MLHIRVDTLSIVALNIFICLAVMLVRVVDGDANLSQILYVQSWALVSLVCLHSIAWFRQGRSDLSLAYLFLLFAFIFNAGKAILFVFYPSQENLFFNFFNEQDYFLVARALEYAYYGLVVLSSVMLLLKDGPEKIVIDPSSNQLVAAKVTGIVFLAVSLPAAIFDLKDQVIQVITGGYFALFSSEQNYGAAGIVKILSFFLFPAIYICLAAYRDNKNVVWALLLFAIFYSLVKLALGSRLVSMIPLLIMFSLWDTCVGRVNRKFIYTNGLIMLAVVFPLLALLRVGGEVPTDEAHTSAFFDIIKEMSDSMSPLVWVMQRVPWMMDFQFGNSFLLALSTAIPNFFWDAHPAQVGSLSTWLAFEVDPWIAKQGGGFGFSIFAELYLNFYWFGLLVLAFFAAFINGFSKPKANPINSAFCYACFLGIMLWPRGELMAVARFIMWNVGIPWLGYRFLSLLFARYS